MAEGDIKPVYRFVHKKNVFSILYREGEIEPETLRTKEPSVLIGIKRDNDSLYFQLSPKEVSMLVAILDGLQGRLLKDSIALQAKRDRLYRERREREGDEEGVENVINAI